MTPKRRAIIFRTHYPGKRQNLPVIMKAWLAALVVLFPLSGFAQRLVTDSFDITIEVRFPASITFAWIR